MAKQVELRRHTDSDGDVLSAEGVRAALEIGSRLRGPYELFVSTGAQRATQTGACFLAAMRESVPGGMVVDERFRWSVEARWKEAYRGAGAGDIESFRKADPDLVEKEAILFGEALGSLFESLPDGGRALVIGHSPMQEAAVYGLAGVAVEPLGKGEGIVVTRADDGSFDVERAP
jgi:broad specificity phosphatase PhoE